VKGAVLQAMGMGMDAPPDVTQCLRHYGVALSESYTEEKHVDGAQHAFISKVDKRTWIPGRLIWAARKGDVILSKIPLTRSIAFSFIFASRNELEKGYVGRVAFVASDMDMPPSHLSGFGDGMVSHLLHSI
jgi:hypothetical protein